MINLFYSHSKVFVWNTEDIYILRKEHRIVGSLIGCNPNKSFQVHNKWLPLQLTFEEAKLLIEKGLAKLVSCNYEENDVIVKSYNELQEKLCEEQVNILKKRRQNTILENADEIYEGKKRKFFDSKTCKNKVLNSAVTPEKDFDIAEIINNNSEDVLTEARESVQNKSPMATSEPSKENLPGSSMEFPFSKEEIISTLLAGVPEVSKEQCLVQLFAECPWKNSESFKEINLGYPSTDTEKLRFAVYKDLWEKGHYITSGCKFGGDFLAYEGDPIKYHALYIVVCIHAKMKLQGIDLVTYGRLGNQVKKTVVLASLNNTGSVEYISLKWRPDIQC